MRPAREQFCFQMLEACTAKQYNHFVRNTSYWGVKCTRICIGLALQVCTYMSLLHPNIGVVLEMRACTGAIQSANYIFWNMSGSFPTSPSRNWFIDSSPCWSMLLKVQLLRDFQHLHLGIICSGALKSHTKAGSRMKTALLHRPQTLSDIVFLSIPVCI